MYEPEFMKPAGKALFRSAILCAVVLIYPALQELDWFSTKKIEDPKGYYAPFFYVSMGLITALSLAIAYALIRKKKPAAFGIAVTLGIMILLGLQAASLYYNHDDMYKPFSKNSWQQNDRPIEVARFLQDKKILEGMSEKEVFDLLGKQSMDTELRENRLVMRYYTSFDDCNLIVFFKNNRVEKARVECRWF